MNAYDQLHEIRDTLEDRGASAETLGILDRAIKLAEPQQDSPLNIPQSMMLKHLLRMPDVLNSHRVEQDLLALAGDLDERWRTPIDDSAPDATQDTERKPQHSHTYYKEQKRKMRADETS